MRQTPGEGSRAGRGRPGMNQALLRRGIAPASPKSPIKGSRPADWHRTHRSDATGLALPVC